MFHMAVPELEWCARLYLRSSAVPKVSVLSVLRKRSRTTAGGMQAMRVSSSQLPVWQCETFLIQFLQKLFKFLKAFSGYALKTFLSSFCEGSSSSLANKSGINVSIRINAAPAIAMYEPGGL